MTGADPIRVAVVGSGPAGFYATGHLLSDSTRRIEVDMLERLPTPWGLVRSGVAPDHPKIKSVTRVFEKTAADPRFRYYGNITVGEHVSRKDLLAYYHAVVYATGAPCDRPLGIPGERLPGSHAATEFVGWYNGHPDHTDLEVDLLCTERAVVIGNGNVALDVARMLVLAPSELALTDVADHALGVLAASRVREVVIVGRRGPAQAAFTNPELLELGELPDADVIVDAEELERALSGQGVAAQGDPTTRRNVEILRSYASREPAGHAKRVVLRFLASPVEFRAGTNGRLARVVLARNELVDQGGALRARPSGPLETIVAGLAFRAVGYRGAPLSGVPFDERSAVIPNEAGRVLDPQSGLPLPGEYAVGWIKRGPSGVIGTNKRDARETIDALLADLGVLADGDGPRPSAGRFAAAAANAEAAQALLRSRRPELVGYSGWEAIDRHERALAEPAGRPRVKLTRIEPMLRVATAGAPTDSHTGGSRNDRRLQASP